MDMPTIISVVAGLVSVGSVIYLAGVRVSKIETRVEELDGITEKFSALEVKVNTMWDFQIRRGFAESVHAGAATMNSPLTIDPHIKEYLNPIKEQLVSFWEEVGRRLTLRECMIELEKRFGYDLLHLLCLPRGIHEGACLLVALSVASGIDAITFGHDTNKQITEHVDSP